MKITSVGIDALVERLRDWSEGPGTDALCETAAVALFALRAERDALREALKRIRPRTSGIDRITVDAALAPSEPKEQQT